MNLFSTLKQSIISLKANKLRSFFSVLGIVIGVAAVVMILSLGQGLKGLITNQIDAYGPNLLDIAVKIPEEGALSSVHAMGAGIQITTMKISDMEAIKNKNRFPYIEAITGQSISQDWVTSGANEKRTILYGASADFPLVVKMSQIDKGRFYSASEENSLSNVVVLGSDIVKDLFKNEEPIGQKIKIQGKNYEIVGVFKPQSSLSFGSIDMNDFVFMPLKTITREILGVDYITEMLVKIDSQKNLTQAKADISRLLRYRHNIKDPTKDDFQIMTMDQILNQINSVSVILNLLLGFLAAISLLVGGIGIMNIMLVAVSERTKEIGLRKSLGATRRDILWQFLIESLVITGLGCFVGIIGGIGYSLIAALVIRKFGLDWPLTISWLAIVGAFIIAVAIGLVFGIYPASRASKLSPIVAMRRE